MVPVVVTARAAPDHDQWGAAPTSQSAERFEPDASRRTRGTLGVMTINREKPPIEVQVIVWVGLAILLAAVGAFVWLFVLGHGFNFPF